MLYYLILKYQKLFASPHLPLRQSYVFFKTPQPAQSWARLCAVPVHNIFHNIPPIPLSIELCYSTVRQLFVKTKLEFARLGSCWWNAITYLTPLKIPRLLQDNAIPILCMILLSPIRESAVEEYSSSRRVCTNQWIKPFPRNMRIIPGRWWCTHKFPFSSHLNNN